MIKVTAKTNIKTETKRFAGGFVRVVLQALVDGMKKSVRAVGTISAQDYLRGPRPRKLDMRKGRLIRAMTGGFSFIGGPKTSGPSTSRNESIEKVSVESNKIIGTKGLKTFEPFDYPEMWEKTGHSGIRPKKARSLRFKTETGDVVFTKFVKPQKTRPFLEPALNQGDREGVYEKIIQNEIDELDFS